MKSAWAGAGIRRAAIAVGSIAVLMVLGSIGLARASTGGVFVLGSHNGEAATATLSDPAGTPLRLKSGKGKPPLIVSNSTVVPRLNAEYVDGLRATSIQRSVAGQCATGIASLTVTGAVSCAVPQLTFTTSSTFVVPAGVSKIQVQAIGAGGGGGLGPERRTGGGGSGGMLTADVTVQPGESLDLVVGAGGKGATGTGAGADGADSVVYSESGSGSILLRAGGGQGGTTGKNTAACALGVGGAPSRPAAAVAGLTAQPGWPGTCNRGGGTAGFAGAGGSPGHGGGRGRDGHAGLIVVTLE